MFSKKQTILIKEDLYDLSSPKILGILNVTPDSFYDGGKYTNSEAIGLRIEQMIKEGADMIDIGGVSTRPGADNLNTKEEIKRIEPALLALQKLQSKTPVSIDTYRSDVAKWAIEEYDVDIINDISGGTFDKKMLALVGHYKTPLVLMHTQGKPDVMQQNTNYNNVTKEVIFDLAVKVDRAKNAGVNDIIIDPGFGFAKDLEQNYELIANLNVFSHMALPIMVGVSRKSMIYKHLNTSAQESLNGTTVLHTFALQAGADILRVHDVKEAREVITLFEKVKEKTKG